MSERSRVLRLGTRRSQLALTQSGQVATALEALQPEVKVELVPIETRGDREPGELAKIGGKGLFTQELEAGLLDGALDFAVHSLKDLPVTLPDGLTLAAYPERVDPRDALVSDQAPDLDGLEAGAVLLTGSQRRRAQILAHRPDLVVEGLRGNVDTRLRIWRERGVGGVILAMSGLLRLGIEQQIPLHALDPRIMIPAPGQGILALEVLEGGAAESICSTLNHAPTARAAVVERQVVEAFGGDCTLPLAAWAEEREGELELVACLATLDGQKIARGEARGSDPLDVAGHCVEVLRSDGAEDVLRALGR